MKNWDYDSEPDLFGSKDTEQGHRESEQAVTPVTEKAGLPSTEFRDSVPEMEEEVNLKDYIEVLLRRKWVVVGFLLLVFISTGIFTLSATKIYKATATLELTQEQAKVTKFEEMVENRVRSQEFLQTQVGLIESKALATRVAEKLDLRKRLEALQARLGQDDKPGLLDLVKGGIKDGITAALDWFRPGATDEAGAPKSYKIAVPEAALEEKRVLDFLQENLMVEPRRNTMIIDLSFTSPDRYLSRDVVQTYADEFVAWQMDQKLEASRLAREFLMKQIKRAQIELERSEDELNRFAKASGIVSLEGNLNSVYVQLEETNRALAAAEAELISLEADYRQAVKEGPGSLPQVMESSMISSLKGQYAEVQSGYQRKSAIFYDDYPEVRALKQRMESIQDQIDREEQKIFQAIKSKYEAAKTRVATLTARAQEKKQAAMDLNERATQYKIVNREVATNKAIYDSLLQRAKEIESMVGVSSSNIHIVDAGSLPILPFKPKVMMNLLLAIVVGLVGGVGLAFFLEYFADSITKPEEITDRFHIPILGVAPLIKAREEDPPVERAFLGDPRAPLSEAIRTTKVSIQLARGDAHTRSFLITSTNQGEGKSTLVSNMAAAFAQAGERVVLVDADLRRPRLHKIFSEIAHQNGKGLSSFLAGIGNEEPVVSTDVANLYLIPAGPIPPNPVELLASNRFAKLMGYLEAHYDRIILDAPPNQGFADVLVLCRRVGGVVMVMTLGETTRDAVRHFKRSILNVNGSLLGCIINRVNFSKRYGYRSYYRYYKHYYNYEYGKDGKKGHRIGKKNSHRDELQNGDHSA
ncbi:MAG: polysaccharide biosynthesis tyrosine autokinase [Deltaproteobacteria bacterium]|nr:polysaccharide biosynthesis tyrosine autokinase [Deltaproteobacteria bacterium]